MARFLTTGLLVLAIWLAGLAALAQDTSPDPAADASDAADAARSTVIVGMYVNDIQAIDLSTYSYGMDFYLWFRWSDPDIDPVSGFEFMNMFDPEAHVQQLLYDEPVAQPDGSFYQIVRHQGLFSAKFPINAYPFDRQTLLIAVEDATSGAEALRYVADGAGLQLNPEIRLPGYRIGTPRLVIRDKPYETAFGDLSQPDVAAYSRAAFIVPITRPVASGVFKAFVPVILIILSAAFALLLDPEHVEARIGLAITALLSLVAMQFTMLAGLPEVAYLTLLDQIYLISYVYILVVIGIVVRGTRVDEQGSLQGERGSTAALAAHGPKTAAIVTGGYGVLLGVIVAVNVALAP